MELIAEVSQYTMSVSIFLFGVGMLGLFLWYFATERDVSKRRVGTVLALLATGFASWASFPLNEKLLLAIDLQGGSAFVVEIQPSNEGDPVTPSAQEKAMEILRKRLDKSGGMNPNFNTQGENRLEIQMPGVKDEDMEGVRNTIQKVARLEFRTVKPGSFPFEKQAGDEPALEPGWAERPLLKRLEEGETQEASDAKPTQYIMVKNRTEVGGEHVTKARAAFLPEGWVILLELDGTGGDKMYETTKALRHGTDQLAILVDGEVISHPSVNNTLRDNIQISGRFTEREAFDLASALENPLKNPLVIKSASQVSAAYGKNTIKQGIYAGLAGLGLTLLFMIVFYRVAGLVALVGLTVNIVLLFGFMCVFKFTLSMPGIAGIVLTIGIAVDANVLIYERLREEMKAGKSLAASIQAAYDKAFSAIFDANVTTLITATIMFMVASGTIKGFAMTLSVGVLASLFAALLVTRVCFSWLTKVEKIKNLGMGSFLSEKVYDFLGKRKIALVVSLVLLAVSVGWISIQRSDALAYDLKGGDLVSVAGSELSDQEILDSIKDLKVYRTEEPVFNTEGNGKEVPFYPPAIQTQQPLQGLETKLIRTSHGTGAFIRAAIINGHPALFAADAENQAGITVDEIGPSIGGELLRNSLVALGLGLLGILIYLSFRFEIAFALGAIAALLHDVVISIGLVSLLGTSLSVMMVGAFLTIAGYSINDTIVVFDRVRETLRTRKGELKDIMNLAISQTLRRTVITSGTTMITCLCLALFGGPTLREFSLAIIVGIFVGTYSSIFVAAPLVLWWVTKRNVDLRQDILDADEAKVIQQGVEREVEPKEA
jgi:SecD/SecF fusion protein